jgi:integrase
MPKLTETYARKLPQSNAGTQKHWDTEVKGFVLFVGKRSKTWYFQKDVGGQTKRILIGRYPTISAQAARQSALELSLEMGRGAGKHVQIGVPTLTAAMDTYLARPKLRSEAHKEGLRQQFDRHLKDWLHLPLDEISKQMVVRKHQSMSGTPSAANHTLKYFRTVWNHARRVYDLPECPTMAIEWYDEPPNGTIIDDLSTWRRTVSDLPNPIHTVFYELLLFTGFRKSEALNLQWKNVYEDRIHLPMTKNGRSFDLPILQIHHEILAPVRGLHKQWVFPSQKLRDRPISAPQRICWSPHAHRRTFATVAMEAGVLEEVVGRLLNHTPLSITGQRYVRPSLEALKPAMEAVCVEISKRCELPAKPRS